MPSPVATRCVNCKHWQDVFLTEAEDTENDEGAFVFTCHAYPEGIPEEIIYEDVLHNTVRSDQTGTFVYER